MNFFLLNSGKGNAAFNMALDEALLNAMPRLQTPVLRFYGWTEPAATFGYFQKFSEVERATALRPLIRRPTGGGIVPHNADWTYAAIFPAGHVWYALKAEESYRQIHDWLRLAFAEMKVNAELAPCCRKIENSNPTNPSACFIGYEKSDLLWHGQKIAGAAQRRNKLGLLIQGSIQAPLLSLARSDFESAMSLVAEKQFGVSWQKYSPDLALNQMTEQLFTERFTQAAYNQKR